ncbi:MAG: extracellular solute-binding protein [Pseudobdellovibrionaceae bacterium]
MNILIRLTAITLVFISTTANSQTAKNQKIVVYTHRNAQLIQPLFDEYKKQTGITIEFLTGEPGALIQKIKAEGKSTPADIFISVDAGTLWEADQQKLFAVTESKVLTDRVPANYRSQNKTWFGLSLRARTIFFNKEKVKATDLVSYADLAEPKWKGKLCLRTSKKVYNQSLVAMMIASQGEEQTKNVVTGWIKNLAYPVFDNDTKLLEAIAKGDCPIGIANTYYLGKLQKEGKAKNVGVYFPSPTHLNISGGGILQHSKNKKMAQEFLEWLTTDPSQKLFADSNLEYPIVPNIQADSIVQAWGTPVSSEKFQISQAGELQRKAIMLIDSVKYE